MGQINIKSQFCSDGASDPSDKKPSFLSPPNLRGAPSSGEVPPFKHFMSERRPFLLTHLIERGGQRRGLKPTADTWRMFPLPRQLIVAVFLLLRLCSQAPSTVLSCFPVRCVCVQGEEMYHKDSSRQTKQAFILFLSEETAKVFKER